MFKIHLSALSGMVLLAACSSPPQPQSATAFAFVAQPCAPAFVSKDTACGSVVVPEDYASTSGRRISLNVIVFRALEPGVEKQAQFDLEGGPGFAVTDSADFYATDGEPYRRSRDVVLVDMRGTGASNPLRCKAIEERSKAQPMAPLYPSDLVVECARQLATVADLRQYTTAAAARDIDAVRQALGYSQIDLNALSYGTTLALRYIADYPQHVRSAVLMGTVPADKTPPAHHALAAEHGLKLIFDACAADKACAKRYPDLSAQLDRAMARLAPEDRAVFLEKLRARLYLPATARTVPSTIHAAAEGNLDALAKPSSPGRVFADGVYLSITCSESLARIDVDKAIAEADTTRFGSYRLVRQRAACDQWAIAPADQKLFRTGSASVPLLLLSGAFDPVSPVEWSAQTAAVFPNSRHVIVPQGAHVFEGLTGMDTCIDAMILKFVATRSVKEIDDSCVGTMDAGPFVLDDAGEVQGAEKG